MDGNNATQIDKKKESFNERMKRGKKSKQNKRWMEIMQPGQIERKKFATKE